MNWQAVFTAMLPEHCLLAGIVLLLCVEIASARPRGSAGLALAVAKPRRGHAGQGDSPSQAKADRGGRRRPSRKTSGIASGM